MITLKTNTATRITVGPFLAVADGITPVTSMTVTNCTCELFHNANDGGAVTRAALTLSASGGNNDMVHITDDVGGYFDLEITAANVNWLGNGRLSIIDTDVHLPVFIDIQVIPANVWDSLYGGTDKLAVDTQEISGDATAADNAESFFDGTGYAGTNNVIPLVTTTTTATTATNLTNLPAAPADWLTAAAVKADAVTKIQNGLALASALATVAGYLDTEIAAILVIAQKLDTALELDGAVYRYTLNALELAPTGGSAPTVEQIRAEIDSNSTKLTAIKDKTDNLPTHPQKNVALPNIPFKMFLSSDHVTPATGKTVTGTTSKDAGAFGAIAGAITEIANGWYKLDGAAQAEMNGGHIVFEFSAADCDVTTVEFLTST